MGTLVLQHESDPNSLNQTFGLEVFHDVAEDYYTVRFHFRTYDGIRVSDSWSTAEVRLDAHSIEGAGSEASVMFKEWLTAIKAQV